VRYNVAQLLKEPIGATREKSIEADIRALDEAIKPLGLLTGHVNLLRTDAGILVRGWVRVEVELLCSCCLTPFAWPLEVVLEDEFRPSVLIGVTKVARDEIVDPALRIDEHHVLDLRELIRQQLLLALPMHPLCRPDCAGLCPQCGQDLNEGPCECIKEPDPRWAILQDLKLE